MENGTCQPAGVLAEVSLADIDPGNRLLADYLADAPALRDFFSHRPDAMREVARRPRAGAPAIPLANALAALQQQLGADPAAVDNARLLGDPATPVITVGQQPGLLGGPLYTTAKALTAIDLARRLTAVLGRPVVPVFWVGVDDDDRAEVDHGGCWDARGRLHTIQYPVDAGRPGQLIGDLPTGDAAAQVLAQVLPLLVTLPADGETAALLRDCAEGAADFGIWCCRLLARLFSPLGLVVCDPRLPEIRRFGAEVVRRELAQPLRTTTLVNEQARALQALGYRPGLTKPADACNVFLYDGVRHRVTFDGDHYHAAGKEFDREALLGLLEDHPERLLPNAVLRPAVQEYLFGSAAFVAGPNEVGYWAELRPVFDALGVAMPPVVARAGLTVVPPGCTRALREWKIAPLHLLHDFDAVRYHLLAQAVPAPVEQAFADSRAALEQQLAVLTQTVAALDSTLAQSAQATHQRLLNELERLERKALKAVERRFTEQTERLEMVRETLFPARGPQERTLLLPGLLARYGLSLPERLLHCLTGKESQHLFVEL